MIKITETKLRKGIQFGLGSQGIWTPELEDIMFSEIRSQALSQHDVIKNEVTVCDCLVCGRKITNLSEASHGWICDDC